MTRPRMLAGVAALLVTACLALYLLIVHVQEGEGPAWWYVTLLGVVITLLALVGSGTLGARVLLAAAVMLLIATVLALLTIGVLLVPALVLVVIAYRSTVEGIRTSSDGILVRRTTIRKPPS